MAIEKTFVLIKPDAMSRRLAGLVLDRLLSTGLEVAGAKVAVVTDKLAREHYRDLAAQPFFEEVVTFLRGDAYGSNKVLAFVLRGENAIAEVRRLVGATNPEKAAPGTVRASFGRINQGVMENAVHASSDPAGAEREIALWFRPEEITA